MSQLGTISRENLLLTAELPWRPENMEQFQVREFQVGIPHPQGEEWWRDVVAESRRAQFCWAVGCRRLAQIGKWLGRGSFHP